MKLIIKIFPLILLLLLVACGGQQAPPVDDVPTVDAPQVPTEEAQPEPTAEEEPTLPPPVVEGEEPGAEAPPTEPAAEAPTEEAPPAPVFPWPEDRFGYGIQVHGNATVGAPGDVMNAVANQLGMDWVKVQVRWETVHPEAQVDQWFIYDGVIDEANRHGLNVLVSVLDAPDWARSVAENEGPPDDYAMFAEFLTEMLTRHEGKIQAVEVWNEQNLDREWTTPEGLSAAAYVNLLSVAHETIKAHNPNIIVVSGALSPTGVNNQFVRDDFLFIDELLAAGMLQYADCVGAHHNGINLPPDVPFDETAALEEASTAEFRGPYDNPHHSWSFRSTLDTYAEKVQAVDPEMKLCVTEFGWASSEGYDVIPEGFGFANDNTLQEQADYIVQAFQQMHDSGNVWLAFLFNFDYGNKGGEPSEDDNIFYSLVDRSGVPRPAFGAVAEMEKTP